MCGVMSVFEGEGFVCRLFSRFCLRWKKEDGCSKADVQTFKRSNCVLFL
jgi:hypothetical protein